MTDVFDEINDDLRREKLGKFWKENGPWIIGGAVGAVLLTAALGFWREWEYRRDTAATAKLTHLVTAADMPKLEIFAKEGNKNHAMLARFAAASSYLERNEKDKAVALYDTIAKTSGIDRTWRDLARVLSISQRLDTGSPADLEKELAGLSDDKGTWRYTARELEALLAIKQGQVQRAVDILSKLAADPLTPTEARARAFTLRELYMANGKGGQKS